MVLEGCRHIPLLGWRFLLGNNKRPSDPGEEAGKEEGHLASSSESVTYHGSSGLLTDGVSSFLPYEQSVKREMWEGTESLKILFRLK